MDAFYWRPCNSFLATVERSATYILFILATWEYANRLYKGDSVHHLCFLFYREIADFNKFVIKVTVLSCFAGSCVFWALLEEEKRRRLCIGQSGSLVCQG